MPDLRALERWMQAVIVHPGTVEEAVRARGATRYVPLRNAESTILPSKTMAPFERIAVYQGMYPVRMHDALKADYPGLFAFLGAPLFEHFVADYVAVHPSRSYTLNRLGDHVPEFLRTWHHDERAFLSDLARLELAITLVFDAAEAPAPRPPTHVDADWASRRFAVNPTLQLLSFRHAVGPAVDALREGKRPVTRAKPSWVAVHRPGHAVRRLDLSRGEFHLLAALAAGEPLGRALRLAARKAGGTLSASKVKKAFEKFTVSRLLGS